MYRNERYFDKNDREQNYYGQLEENDSRDILIATKTREPKKEDERREPVTEGRDP